MTAVAVAGRHQVHVALRRGAALVVGSGDEPVALASEEGAEHALAVADLAPRALALQSREQFGMSFQGRRLFTAIGAVAGRQGKAGPPGVEYVEFIAGTNLSGHRAVAADGEMVEYASADDPASAERCVGVTSQAVVAGATVQVKRAGLIVEPTWAWQAGPVFLAGGGSLTQVPPDSGTWLQIGVALDATTLDVRLGTPIFLD